MTRSAKARSLMVVALTSAMLAVVWVQPGSAAVGSAAPAKYSTADCETLFGLSENVPDTGGNSVYGASAKAVADGFETTAADIDNKKLRKAMLRLADVYDDLGDAKSAAAAAAVTIRAGKGYLKAIRVWGTASVQCITSTVTIPTLPSSITLPTGITLPAGITIPR
jgi:hypothetical protein